ncbi:glycosyltransferase [Halorhabdus sp. CBA1104]|uniref:glycosyltransferase n=1 Tax=unclassified Halorhabdus TaxID=2621901 RepID=UPI0012B3473A|nr:MULTISPECIES: glycosyltransferase [unclassified Halorhabdus]QGN06628.1 glycosyltransferase [Halorhabdus sp. CBA1104]
MSRSVGLVVPAYRPDVPALESYVAAIRSEVDLATVRIEIDDPREETIEQLDALDVSVNAVPYRRGKGAAITTGFEALETDVFAFADADGSTPAESLAAVIEPVAADQVDLAAGSRRHPEATIQSHQTFARRFLGDGFAWFARRMLDAELHDYQCGAKALSASAWADVRGHLFEPGFAWDVELVAIAGALDLRIAEVPITWEDKPGSTVSPVRTSLDLAGAVFAARHRAKRLRDSRLHQMIASQRSDATALIDRESQ